MSRKKRHLQNIQEVRLISPRKIIFPRHKWVNLPKYEKVSQLPKIYGETSFFNQKNFTEIVLVRGRTVIMKNMAAVTSDSNFQPNAKKTGERQSAGTWLPGK